MNKKAAEDMQQRAEEVAGFEVLINCFTDSEVNAAEIITQLNASNFGTLSLNTNGNNFLSALLYIEGSKTEAEHEYKELLELLERMDTNALSISELTEEKPHNFKVVFTVTLDGEEGEKLTFEDIKHIERMTGAAFSFSLSKSIDEAVFIKTFENKTYSMINELTEAIESDIEEEFPHIVLIDIESAPILTEDNLFCYDKKTDSEIDAYEKGRQEQRGETKTISFICGADLHEFIQEKPRTLEELKAYAEKNGGEVITRTYTAAEWDIYYQALEDAAGWSLVARLQTTETNKELYEVENIVID